MKGSILIAAAMAILPSAGAVEEFHALTARGRAALEARDYESAREALERAVALRPRDPGARHDLARAYIGEKKYQPAAEQLQEVLRIAPGTPAALVDLGGVQETAGRLDDAARRYREALLAGPDPRAERGLASILSKQGRTGEAIGILTRLVGADSEDLESRYRLGLALAQGGDCSGAAEAFAAVVRRQASHIGALFNLGNCLNRLDRREEAERVLERFREASRLENEEVDRRRRAYFLLLQADGLLERGDTAGALRTIEEAIRLAPGDAKSHAVRGQCLEARGDAAGALEAYLRAASLAPADPIIRVEAGRLLGKTGRFEEAIPHLEEAARLDPLMPEPHLLLAAVYHQIGRPGEAAREEATYRRLLDRGARKP